MKLLFYLLLQFECCVYCGTTSSRDSQSKVLESVFSGTQLLETNLFKSIQAHCSPKIFFKKQLPTTASILYFGMSKMFCTKILKNSGKEKDFFPLE